MLPVTELPLEKTTSPRTADDIVADGMVSVGPPPTDHCP